MRDGGRLEPHEALVRNHLGQWLIIDQATRSSFMRYRRFDWLGLDVIERALAKMVNPIAVDVGANIGNHTLVLAHHCRQVFAFEPQLRSGIRLADNVAMNGLTNVLLNDFGLSDRDSVESLYISPVGNGGESTMIPVLARAGGATVEVPVRIGDDVLDAHQVDAVDLIKIDVEGFEAHVVAGLQRTIVQYRPLLFLEWNNEETRRRFAELRILETILAGWRHLAIVDSHGRSQFGEDAIGRFQRLTSRCFLKRRAVLTEFAPLKSYENVVFFHPSRAHLLNPVR